MVDKKSIDFLPQVFRTNTNRRFLNATVDQLIQEPNLDRVYGYIGKQDLNPVYRTGDAYVQEIDSYSQYYQLEPGLVINERVSGTNKFKKKNAYNYIDLLNGVALSGGINTNHNRLFANEYYNYEGFVEHDKLINYVKYYWLPSGPKTLMLTGKGVEIAKTFIVSRPLNIVKTNSLISKNIGTPSYSFDAYAGQSNPDITLVRGGVYSFNVSQKGNPFWIQIEPGVEENLSRQDNISRRDVFGVDSNGIDSGVITFRVPNRGAQSTLQFMNTFETIDFVTDIPFSELQNQNIVKFQNLSGLDGVKSFTSNFIVFTDTNTDNWWDPRDGSIIPENQRTGIWKISLNGTSIRLDYVKDWPTSTKLFVNQGREYGNINILKTPTGSIIKQPNITSELDTLYYQDGVDSNVFGKIFIIDEDPSLLTINVNDIIGQKEYISTNGIVFTNGLKIKFDGNVIPSSYADNDYVVEGVGKSIKLIPWSNLVTPDPNNPNIAEGFSTNNENYDENAYGATLNAPTRKDYIVINRSSIDGNAWSRTNRWFHEDVIRYSTTFNNPTAEVILDNAQRASRPIVEFDADLQLWNYGNKFISPVTAVDIYATDIANQIEGRAPYILKDADGNYYSDDIPLIDGTRVIFINEKYEDVKNKIYEVQNINPHTPVTFTKNTVGFTIIGSSTLKFSNVGNLLLNMAVTASNIPENTVIMSIDTDNNTITLNNSIDNDLREGSAVTFNSNVQQVHLTPIHTMSQGELVVAITGLARQNQTYWWNNNTWQLAQQKFSLNQSPLYDIFNLDGISIGDKSYYPSSTFEGSKLFGYKIGAGTVDSELGFALSYKNIGNIGDIVFENYYDSDQFHFNYNNTDQVLNVSIGYVYEIVESNLSYKLRNNWVKITDLSKQYVEVKQEVSLSKINNFSFNVEFINSFSEKNIFVYVNGVEINRSKFELYGNSEVTEIVFNEDLNAGDIIVLRIFGNNQNTKENFTLPKNLVDNSINDTFVDLTLGQIRNHVQEIANNSLEFKGNAIGINNLRDINYKVIPGKILQHSAGVHVAQLMFNNETTNIIKAIDFSRRSYSRFKDRLMYLINNVEFADTSNARVCLDSIMSEITANNSNEQSFYYTDMIPYGSNSFIENHYGIFDTKYRTFNLINQFDINTPFYNAVLVYLNNQQLVKDTDYTMNGNIVVLLNSLTLEIDDVVSIYEYDNTMGCMIPATPTKLGLYPKFTPQLYVDNTYLTDSVNMIQGHDGSKILAFDDYRDDIILEFEKRVYNNIGVNFSNDARTCFTGIEPGAFRNTDYSINEWTQLLSSSFLSWAGSNNVNVFENNVSQTDPFSYNYSNGIDKLFQENLPGYWRGIFKYFYDTDRPHTHPWEMLGFTEEPTWWELRYGPAPYTAGNTVLWNDLENGLIYQHGYDSYVDVRYARPNLSLILPVDDHGDILPPITSIVNTFDGTAIDASWRFGDQSPQETAWRRSSDYPFAVQIAWALARPAQYASLSLNRRDLVRINSLDQIINIRTSKRKVNLLITDETQYIPGSNIWIRDRLTDLSLDITTNFKEIFENFDLNLIYKLSGYTDKSYLNVVADQATPNSTNTGFSIPQENYNVVFTKSAPIGSATYSAIIIEKNGSTYSVYGFDTEKPYFTTIPRKYEGPFYNVSISQSSAKIYTEDLNVIEVIPYGTQFSSKQQVVDFLISYGHYLNNLGFQFSNAVEDDISPVRDWSAAVKEFLFLLEQGWVDNNNVISLTPSGTKIAFDSKFGVVDDIMDSFNDSQVINSNGKVLQRKEYVTQRNGTKFILELKDKSKGIHLLKINVVQYEHSIIFDNVSVFNDIIYQPNLGNRQNRIKIDGYRTREWDGSLYAPGFLINHLPIELWMPMQDYYKGDIVEYKNKNYTAKQFIPGTSKFNDASWYVVNSKILNRQLIMNLASSAEQMENFYDVDQFDVNRTADSLARNSTGFVPRTYMTDIGLDNISQHKFYLGMIREKGTQAAINAFMRAQMTYMQNGVEVKEQWAVRLGNYGGIDTKLDVEVSLENAKSYNGGYIVELLDRNQPSSEHANSFAPKDLLIRPPFYSPNIFEAKGLNPAMIATAGPVLGTDVDATVFDIQRIQNINDVGLDLGEGSRIWIASDKKNEWNVLRVTADSDITIIGVVVVGNELEFTTDLNHGLVMNDNILLKNGIVAKIDISGFYRVNSVNGKTFKVPVYDGTTTSNGKMSAKLYKLKSIRYNHKGRFALNSPGRGWAEKDTVWVDGLKGNWEVITNSTKWTLDQSLTPVFAQESDSFGNEIDVKSTQDMMLVGAPSKGNSGYAYVYRQNSDDTWSVIHGISPDDVYAKDFGYSVKFSEADNAVIGAPSSYNSSGLVYTLNSSSEQVEIHQVLNVENLPPESRFGHSVSISKDKQWVAVGAPGINKVYMFRYSKVAKPTSVTYTTYGKIRFQVPDSTLNMDLKSNDFRVYLNYKLLVPFIDYKVENKNVVLKGTVYNNIVETGLLLFLDASIDVYPGIGINWNDKGPAKNNATLIGSPVYHNNEAEGSFTFNGTNQYASVATNLLNTTYTGKTVFVVCRMSSAGWTSGVEQFRALFGNNSSTSLRNFNFYIRHRSDNAYNLHFSTPGSHTNSGVVQIVPDNWMVLAVTQDATTTRYYVNGVQVDVITGTSLHQYISGGLETLGKADTYWDGDIAACLIYNRALTPGEIHKNYNIFALRVGLQPLIVVNDKDNNENDILNIVYDSGYSLIDTPITNALPPQQGTVYRLINNVVSTVFIDLGWDQLAFDVFSWDHADDLGNFGSSVSLSANGNQLLVGAPNLTPTIQERKDTIFEENETQFEEYDTYFVGYINREYQKMGAAFVYNLDKEVFIPKTETSIFTLDNRPIMPKAYIDGIENKGFFVTDSPTTSTIIFNKPIHIDSIVEVETNVYDLLEIKLAPNHSKNLLFGSKVLICPNTCSLYIGAVGYNAIGKGNGAVYRYVNAARVYGSISGQVSNPIVKMGENIRLNGIRVDFTGTTLNDVVNDINNIGIPGVTASITTSTSGTRTHNYLLIKSDSELAYNRLNLGLRHKLSSYVDLGLNIFDLYQTIVSPSDQDTANFGNQITLNPNGDRVLIGANRASSRSENSFDNRSTTFDLHSTKFNAVYYRSGSAYLYEYQGDIAENPIDHGNFAFAQMFSAPALVTDDFFSSGVALTNNWAVVTALGSRNGAGTVYTYYNPTGKPNWETVRHKLPSTDSRNIERIYLYNDNTKLLVADLPVIDPEHGIPVPSAMEQIKYIVNYDPAVYTNTPNKYSFATDSRHAWADEHVGELWWDTNQIKYNEWNQGDLVTRYNNWGVSFPNSYVSVYEWIESNVPPSQYTGTSSPLYTVSEVYTKKTIIDKQSRIPVIKYYFWAANSNSNDAKLKRQTAIELQDLINNPRNINDPFAAVISGNAIALYNCQDIINNDIRLHISLKNTQSSNPLHSEWGMFDDGSDLGIAVEFLDRLNDSMSGQDAQGRVVPDEKLSEKQRYGISIRPRQTTFVDKFDARQTWVTNVNGVMANYPMVLLRDISPLFDFDPVPVGISMSDLGFDTVAFNTFGWDIEISDFTSLTVENDTELEYLDKNLFFIGQEVIVTNDSTSNGWTVRHLSKDPADKNSKIWNIVSVKKYDLRDYWTYSDWYAPQYNANTTITHTINYEYEISSINPQVGDIIKIKNSNGGNWKLTVVKEDFIELVGQQNATIQFNSKLYDILSNGYSLDSQSIEIASYAKDSAIEFRKIFDIVNYKLLVKELRSEYKNILLVLIDKIATQFKQNDWLLKTSFIDIKHHIRSLDQIPTYVKQPEAVVNEFISEVKPYHTKIKKYVSSYNKTDVTSLDLVDFDLPAYYNNVYATYRQPQLGNLTDTSAIGNLSSIININVTSTGTGYYNNVNVVIEGDGKDAYAVAKNEFGRIVGIDIIKGGYGYTYATIKIVGTGSGAAATAQLGEIEPKLIYGPWLNNHTYSIEYIDVFDGGQGYDENTVAVIEGDGHGATANVITQDGKVTSIDVITPGYGYTNAMSYKNGMPIGIKIVGAGTGARAYAKLSNALPRTFNSIIKFDRFTYKSMTKEWMPNTVYDVTDIITHNSKVYRLITDSTTKVVGTSITTTKSFVTSSLTELDIKHWEPNQSFRRNTIVLYQQQPYVALVDFTSGRNFEYNSDIVVTNSINWEPTTTFSEGTIINYNNVAYIALIDFTSPVIFTVAHLRRILPLAEYPGGYLIDAASRIWAYYNPVSGMPGKDLSQLMTGISYPGVNVKGSDFDQHSGFGVGVFEQNGYDLRTIDDNGIEFIYGKQAIDTTLTSLYTDTLLGQRPEDMITDGGAYIDTYSGYAPEELIPGHMFDALSLRVRTQTAPTVSYTPEIVVVAYYSDGFTKRFSFDPKITGTNLPVGGVQNIVVYDDIVNYSIRYEGVDYNIDWENQLIEFVKYPSDASTVIFNLIGNSGKMLVAEENFIGNGMITDFKIADALTSIQQAYVRINHVTVNNWIILTPTKQIRPDYSDDVIVTDWVPAKFYAVDSYVRYNNVLYRVVTEHISVYEFNKACFTNGNDIILRFDNPPLDMDKVEVHLFDFPIDKKAFSEVIASIHSVPSTYVRQTNAGYRVTLPEALYVSTPTIYQPQIIPKFGPFANLPPINISESVQDQSGLPYEPNIIVRLNGLELEPSNQSYYVGDGISKDFPIISTRVVNNSDNIDYNDITVIVNGVQSHPYTDYTINVGTEDPLVTFINAPSAGANIVISNRFNASFIVTGNNSILIKPSVRVKANDKISILMISTHDQYNVRCQVFSGSLSTATKLPTYTLSRPATNLNNLRVTVNGNWLNPFYEFKLISPTKLRIDPTYNLEGLSTTDVVVVTHIDDNVRIPDIEFKMFKGINESYEFIGIGSKTKTKLAQDLAMTDTWIYVEDTSVFSKPDAGGSTPGVVFVNGERITFFIFDEVNNRLGQIRRSTNGTGAGALYKAGSIVHDGGNNAIIPNIVEDYITADRETTIVGKTGASKTINKNEKFRQGKLWIDQGEFTPATGEGIAKSNTTQVKFLKALR